ncbi:MAG TPA: HAD family phosphatase [Gaiellaceae bacterium]|jgi:HAD superfamily hydrolase (TIGR01509 family)|nr:HAD family phosphatase [Gaiellaceae bacterium]
MTTQAIVFDFNGTLSDDEPVLARVYQELIPGLTVDDYYARLAGHTDEHIFDGDTELIDARVARYNELVSDGSTVDEETREAVRYAAARVPVALVSAAMRAEIHPVLDASGIRDAFTVIVAQDDVTHGKPDPEPYLRAAELLALPPSGLLVFEDTDVGVAAARAAGAYVIGLTRTIGAKRMGGADELIERIDLQVMDRLLCS